MDDRSALNDSISDFARFISAEMVENYREEHPDFLKGAGAVDAFAKALVDQYRRKDSTLLISAPPEAEVYGVTSNSSSSKTIFPLDFNVPIPFGKLHGQVTNPGNDEYLLTATFEIADTKIDTTEIRFKDGVLSRTEEIDIADQTVSTTFAIDLSDGVHLLIEGHVKVLLVKFDIGPYRIP